MEGVAAAVCIPGEESTVNVILWVAQIALAVRFGSLAYTHGVRPDAARWTPGVQRLGPFARPLLYAVAVTGLAAAVGLILPGALGCATWLARLTAALLVPITVGSVAFHVRCRPVPKVGISLALALLAAFVAYGRWIPYPF
jgi:hypothetical protein